MKPIKIASTALLACLVAVGASSASVIDAPSPTDITYTFGTDAKIQRSGYYIMYLNNNGTSSLYGSINSSGITAFNQIDMNFDAYDDGAGNAVQLQVLGNGDGTFCPNS